MISTWAFIGSQAIWVFLVLILIRRNDTIREGFFMLKAQNELKSEDKPKIPDGQVFFRDKVGHGNDSCGYSGKTGDAGFGISSAYKHELENKIASLEAEKKDLLVEISTLLIEFDDANNRNEAGYKDYFNARIRYVANKILPQLKKNNIAENNAQKIKNIITAIAPM